MGTWKRVGFAKGPPESAAGAALRDVLVQQPHDAHAARRGRAGCAAPEQDRAGHPVVARSEAEGRSAGRRPGEDGKLRGKAIEQIGAEELEGRGGARGERSLREGAGLARGREAHANLVDDIAGRARGEARGGHRRSASARAGAGAVDPRHPGEPRDDRLDVTSRIRSEAQRDDPRARVDAEGGGDSHGDPVARIEVRLDHRVRVLRVVRHGGRGAARLVSKSNQHGVARQREVGELVGKTIGRPEVVVAGARAALVLHEDGRRRSRQPALTALHARIRASPVPAFDAAAFDAAAIPAVRASFGRARIEPTVVRVPAASAAAHRPSDGAGDRETNRCHSG